MKYCTFFECMSPWAAAYTIPVASYILFLNITDNEKAVKKGIEYKNSESDDYDNIIPPQRYQKYANGGFPINSFAHKIYNKGNKGKFMNFLKSEASGSTLKEKLYNNFYEMRHELKKEHIFENQQDLFNDIADAFLEILEDAAEEYKNSPRNNPRKASNENAEGEVPLKTESSGKYEIELEQISLPEDIVQETNDILLTSDETHSEISSTNTISIDLSSKSKDKLNELKALIEELSANLLNLNDKGGSYNCCSWILSKDEREEKKQEFEKLRNEFISKNGKLRYYYLSFPELKDTFEKMIHISRVVKYGVYTITEANDVMPVCDPEITEYEECIKAVWKALSK